ncbi:MAG: phosphoribosylformylglycinamidine synthase [Flammeovirgaceae bacterium]
MITFFQASPKVFAVQSLQPLTSSEIEKLIWLTGGAKPLNVITLKGVFIGARKEMVSPWSTNAVEITQNMGIEGIVRFEEFTEVAPDFTAFDKMIQARYEELGQEIFTIDKKPETILFVENIATYNQQEGLALSDDEIQYLEEVSQKLARKLTDSEVFGFSQVNSEHCRHKIFNGQFVLDGKEMKHSLFQLIKKTTQTNPNEVISAYKDNVAFIKGSKAEQFAPTRQDKSDYFDIQEIDSIISLKAETHNFPTTVEPFNGAATGSGGEIRDRMAGGKGSIPLAGTAVYMTSYPRLEGGRAWETATHERKWLYQTPLDILIKASNGASDFGNKFGQPLIAGSLLTFEHKENDKFWGYDKVIMMAGGVGTGRLQDSLKAKPEVGDVVVLLGGDNYRIGMGGGAVSSVATGQFNNSIELNAVQRSNPEMQKRVYNVIRAMTEYAANIGQNPIVAIHDHGAGGHLNCFSELLEETGGVIWIDKLPIGDSTLSAKEIIGNESQERMGLVVKESDLPMLQRIAARERAPMYVVGKITGNHILKFENTKTGETPIHLPLENLFGKPPKTLIKDKVVLHNFSDLKYDVSKLQEYLEKVLQLEGVACKDWLTNKVDRSVTGRVAKQQTCGVFQLPLNNVGVMTLDYRGEKGIATAIGHAPVASLISAAEGAKLAVAESLTNLVFAPLEKGLKGVSLSANWMWACKNEGEDARIYQAVEALSNFCIELEINVPTGKDSLSMTQKYPDGKRVYAPGTVIVSAVAQVSNVRKVVEPVIQPVENSKLIWLDFSQSGFELGGSCFAQILNSIGKNTPKIQSVRGFVNAFEAVQELIKSDLVLAGHDVSSGGLITALLEMTFAAHEIGLEIDLNHENFEGFDIVQLLFSEKPSVLLQVTDEKKALEVLEKYGLIAYAKVIGIPLFGNHLGVTQSKKAISLKHQNQIFFFPIPHLRDIWMKTSYLLDIHQSGEKLAKERYENYKELILDYEFSSNFSGKLSQFGLKHGKRKPSGTKAAILREKGINGDREMAYSLYLAGFEVKDVHVSDLMSGREDLSDIQFLVYCGGFSHSDVLGSAKGWASAFLYNEKAKKALESFYKRTDTLSLGVCNGCQFAIELGLITPEHTEKPKMLHNTSGKFESIFLTVNIMPNHSMMLSSMVGQRLGIWVAHGEGRFYLPYQESNYHIPLKYTDERYPANPNGSSYNAAGLCSADGRHLVMMPHLERSIFPWNWAYYPLSRKQDEVSPWIEAFVNARKWLEGKGS